MKAKIVQIEVNENKRMIAISDIHGNLQRLKTLLEKINYSHNDILFIVGDTLEKGLHSLKTLQYLFGLSKTNEVYMLCGNCDTILDDIQNNEDDAEILEYTTRRKNSIIHDMCNELSITVDENFRFSAVRDKIISHFEEIFEWYNNLPHIIETQKFIFAHAGLTSKKLDENEFFTTVKNDDFLLQDIAFDKYVIVGHMPVINTCDAIGCHNPKIDEKRKVIGIDGGNVIRSNGQLNAFIIENSVDFSFDSVDELPHCVAKSAQQSNDNSINLTCINEDIELISQDDKFSLCRHISSNTELYIPNESVWVRKGKQQCNDGTNYRIEVEKGESLSYIQDIGDDCLVKKDGVIGLISKDMVEI
ncbi:MAG: metallophosphoesterase [Oscillospiraceae bacterium]